LIGVFHAGCFPFGNFFNAGVGFARIKSSFSTIGPPIMKLKIFLVIVGIVQLVLGVAYLLVPQQFLAAMGHSPTAADINYPLGMLAARFLAYGIGLLVMARTPERHAFWIVNMVFIQSVDLAVGMFYTLTGVVPLKLSAFPMFNATLIAALLWWWRPRVGRDQAAMRTA